MQDNRPERKVGIVIFMVNERRLGTEIADDPDVNLTNCGKKGTFENRVMTKAPLRGIAAASLGIVLVFGCAGPRRLDQISFGIWAAERDLWDEAIFRWQKVLAAEPGSAAAHNNLAVAYEKKGLWEEARKEYQVALKLAPDNPWVRHNYTRFLDHLNPGTGNAEDKASKDEKK